MGAAHAVGGRGLDAGARHARAGPAFVSSFVERPLVNTRAGKRIYIALLAVILLGSFWLKLRHLDHAAIKPLDEVFHAIVARNLLKHPLTPTLVDQPFLPYTPANWQNNYIWLHKPPMGLWQIALSYLLFGVNTLGLRMPSAVLSTLAAGLTYLIGAKLLDRTAGLVAAALQAFNPVILMLVHGYVFSDHVDISLLFWTELSIYFLIRALLAQKRLDLILCGIAQGLAFLSKTYPALIVTGLALVAWLLPRTPLVGHHRRRNLRYTEDPDSSEGVSECGSMGVSGWKKDDSPSTPTHPYSHTPTPPQCDPGLRRTSEPGVTVMKWPLSGKSVLTICIATAATILPWFIYTAIRFPGEFVIENLAILQHVNQNVEGWAAPWDRLAFDYCISIFYVYYPAILAAMVVLIVHAFRQRRLELWLVLAWAIGVMLPNLLVTSKTMSSALIGWPAMWLMFGYLISRALCGGRWALGTWIISMLLAATLLNAHSVPIQGWGYGPPGFASIMRLHLWVVWQCLAALTIGAGLFLFGGSLPRWLHWTLITVAAALTLFLAMRWWPGDHPRGYVDVAWQVTEMDKEKPSFAALGAFAEKLPTNAALIVDEQSKLENKLIEFAADRSCYALGQQNWQQPATELAEAGALPYLVSAHPQHLPAVFVDRAEGRTVYACMPAAANAAAAVREGEQSEHR
jgi:hypothetical protein